MGIRSMRMRVEQPHDGSVAIALTGDLTRDDARRLVASCRRLARRREVIAVRLDFSAVKRFDTAGAVAVSLGCRTLEDAGKRCELSHLSRAHEAALRMLAEPGSAPPRPPSRTGVVQRIRARALRITRGSLDVLVLIGRTVSATARGLVGRQRLELGRTVEQAVVLGVDAAPVVGLLGLLIGVILAFQAGYQLRKFGAEIYMAELVGLGMAREFGAVITAVILAGRSGAAIAAELGTMRVNEEVDALESMGIDPVGFLVVPRVAGLSLVQPLLSLMAMALGIAAGIGVARLVGVPPRAVFFRIQEAVTIDDFVLGLLKSVLFAWIIAFTSCFMGLRTRGGAHGVGTSTTRAVVASIVLVIVVDSLVTTAWTVSHV